MALATDNDAEGNLDTTKLQELLGVLPFVSAELGDGEQLPSSRDLAAGKLE
jgi:hypothetical protein